MSTYATYGGQKPTGTPCLIHSLDRKIKESAGESEGKKKNMHKTAASAELYVDKR